MKLMTTTIPGRHAAPNETWIGMGLAAAIMFTTLAAADEPEALLDGKQITVEKEYIIGEAAQDSSGQTESQEATTSATTESDACVWSWGQWKRPTIRVWVSDAIPPGNLPTNALSGSVRYACAEWSCHSSVEFVPVASEADANFTIRWVHLDDPDFLGWQVTSGNFYYRRGTTVFYIARSEVYLNSNTLYWTLGDSPIALADHWPPKLLPDGCQAEDQDGGVGIDLLAMVMKHFGQGLGLEGKYACGATDPCHNTTMNDCDSAGRFSRRALNPADIAAIQALYK